mmetsp:Transcript_14163/g.33542  ORF Transcript_14163/g.33542 Transcript_14163/m.33542 type:complete len:254 (+) Transcript_14163:571-1332(+)
MDRIPNAEGTAARGLLGKCCVASRYPSAALCMPVSIEIVRAIFSPMSSKYLGMRYPPTKARVWRETTGRKELDCDLSSAATPAMGVAHRHEVSTTMTRGEMGLIWAVMSGRYSLATSPSAMGASVTLTTLLAIEKPSNTFLAPRKTRRRSGVITPESIVLTSVMRIETGRSQPAMKHATFDAWLPGLQARTRSPVAMSSSFRNRPMRRPRRGVRPYWRMKATLMGHALDLMPEKSLKVRVVPMLNMMIMRKSE